MPALIYIVQTSRLHNQHVIYQKILKKKYSSIRVCRVKERERESLNKFSRKMLKDVFNVIINNSFKESFYRKKIINILTAFSISNKSGVKTFLNWIGNHFPKGTI